ncbi:hypothetical protein P175DRAFT_0431385 [Aspergillus ochraceoroseus IBT 24754]|uniref:Fungal-type protein kinase domain-containing protein n=2 Tax=Aspergillus ochraceoroseus TaxID=138278 RepID=A0A2T5M3T6_9EURO|nr:uncharacterized protein P175DRAFT_0431385 [Aspergillus ochraceoroseus IBT 24754]KKK12770.1 hypothetical protein AOCH_002548 [Aspergillus ochraceoroseus]PTU23203.1 hypothetical protein P175DRAFT_0431385 [Aspergillus ochraceoroseus IBT 24754]
MPSPESQKHKELRGALRALAKHFNSLETHQFDYSHLKTHKVDVLPMDLDNSKTRPKFFTPCAASLLMNPDYEYDRTRRTYCDFDLVSPIRRLPIDCARNMISYFSYYIFASNLQSNDYIHGKWSSISVDDTPFTGLFDHASPEYGTPTAAEYTDYSCTHIKAMIYNDLEGNDSQLLRGEIVIALRLIYGQFRRLRFFEHLTAPVLLFSFMGPQHARIIEAYFDGSSLVMRPTRLFDLRKKDEALIKTFGQWYLGSPTGDTKVLGSCNPDPLQT